ncbi:MAG: hypothetical protein H6970_13355 [Gammaproteobacteria bacterium]|nr:hypothetical protein [Gammaproteobacteria bacterium]
MRSVTEHFIWLAERIAGESALPCVKALHLPTATTPVGKDAEFAVLELEDGSCGFSYVWLADTLAGARRIGAERMSGASVLTWVREYGSADPARRAIGLAAFNALSQHLFARVGWIPDETADPLGQLNPQPGERIGMVGFFPPLAPLIVASGAQLTVLELKPELAGTRDGYRVTLDPAELAGSDKVLSTSTVLLNDTLDRVLVACRDARSVVMVGPTAGCLPDPLFARGVHSVGGARVIDRPAFLDAFHSGQPWGRYTRKYMIRRQDYPGVEGLLERLPNNR